MSYKICCVPGCSKTVHVSYFQNNLENVTCSPECHHKNRMIKQRERRINGRWEKYLARCKQQRRKPSMDFAEFDRRQRAGHRGGYI